MWKPSSAALKKPIVNWIIARGMPLSITDNAEFRAIASAIHPDIKMPSKGHIKSTIKEMDGDLVQATTKSIKNAHTFIALTTDGWTAPLGDHVIGTNFSFMDEAFLLHTGVLGANVTPERQTSEQIASVPSAFAFNIRIHAFACITPNFVSTGFSHFNLF
jgi:hypothetical protein